ncbi:MAG: hypothetical protein WBW33_36645, partial [Bryobacteraceae bacterium]
MWVAGVIVGLGVYPLAHARGCSENTWSGGLRKPSVDELCRVWGHAYSAHGELALRRRFETLEVSMTSGRGVPDELRS